MFRAEVVSKSFANSVSVSIVCAFGRSSDDPISCSDNDGTETPGGFEVSTGCTGVLIGNGTDSCTSWKICVGGGVGEEMFDGTGDISLDPSEPSLC